MAKLRKIQFYRNGNAQLITNAGGQIGDQAYLVDDLKSAYVYAEASFKNGGKYNDMLDGEILLYRFSYNGTVHTLVGVVHAAGATKSLEVLANYDMLGAEISNEIAAAIAELDGSATIASVADNVVTLRAGIVQANGIVSQSTDDDIVLAKVAKTGAAADVSIADAGGIITATTVEGALAEIAAEIDGMDLTATSVVALNGTTLQTYKISETDGKVKVENADGDAISLVEFNQELSATNKVATMADVTAAAVSGQEAIVVDNAPQGSTTGKVVSLKINSNDNVLTQDANGLLANISLTYDSTNKKIKLFGKEGVNAATATLGEIDATDFIKDGMLADATIVPGTWADGEFTESETGKDKAIKFVWKTYQQGQSGQEELLKTEYLNVESLVDAYTNGNQWIEIDGANNTISHKTQDAFTQEDGEETPQTTFGANTATEYTADAAGESVEFKVPSFTVDGAGHVTAASEKTVKVALPEKRTAATVTVSEIANLDAETVQEALAELQGDINAINAVNWNGDGDTIEGVEGAGEIIVNDTTHTISHKQHVLQTTASTNTDAVKSVVIPKLTVNGYGHVTAIENQTFNIDFNVTTVSGTAGQIVVTSTPAEGTEDINYTVGLAKVVTGEATNVAPTQSTDDYVAEGTTEAPKNKHTRVENITVDAYGRVTAYTLTTVEENWDCGSW